MAPSSLVAIETECWTEVVVVERDAGTKVEVVDEVSPARELADEIAAAVSTSPSSRGGEAAEVGSLFELPLTT